MNPRVPWMPFSKCLSLRGSLVWLPWERRPLLASRNVPAWSTWKAREKRRDGEDLWEMIMTYSKIMCHNNNNNDDDDDSMTLYIGIILVIEAMMVIILVLKVGILIIVAMNHVMQYVKSELKCINQISTLTSGFDFLSINLPVTKSDKVGTEAACHSANLWRCVMNECQSIRAPVSDLAETFRLWMALMLPKDEIWRDEMATEGPCARPVICRKMAWAAWKAISVSESSAAEPGCSVRHPPRLLGISMSLTSQAFRMDIGWIHGKVYVTILPVWKLT